MFTGIVEEVGRVVSVRPGSRSATIEVESKICSSDAKIGDSISINGCCLTIVSIKDSKLTFEAVPETMSRTNLGSLKAGSPVNLERAIAVGSRLGGHFMQGHVDGVGTVQSVKVNDNAHIYQIDVPEAYCKYLVEKGSVAIDGISLTVAEVSKNKISLWIIPHTYENTVLKFRGTGDKVNLEVDMLAKYVEKLLLSNRSVSNLTIESLAESGFA